MNFKNNKFRKYQEGGAAPAPTANPEQAGEGGGDIMAMAQQALQNGDGEMALQVLAALIEMIAAQGGGGAPAPEQQAQPTFQRHGGVITGKTL